ncbi:M48 family metallopeptidase [Coprobacter sp.]
MKKYKYEDPEFGTIILLPHPTARHFIFKIRNNTLQITVPDGIRYTQITQSINQNRENIRKIYARKNDTILRPGTLLETRSFTIAIQTHIKKNFLFRLQNKILYVFCPEDADVESQEVQKIISSGIKRFIKQAAIEYLPKRLNTLAHNLNIRYNHVSVSHGRKRLGRCDTQHNILLSYHLMFLPERLIDYVIFHELAHLSEMNHGDRFHQLCNQYCQGQEKSLEKELKAFPFPID